MILPLLHPVERALAWSALVPRDGGVLVAVSGGADSMALVDVLGKNAAHRLIVAHFDHRLRDDSARDAEHVAAYAREHGLEFVLGSEDVARRARLQRASIEEAAREARYEFFAATAERCGAVVVATAHTRSDQVETILMRILRGAGSAGVAGIPARRGLFVRPLLDVARADTRDYCATHSIAFLDDPSNDDVRFFRNRVRHEILPSLRAAFPAIDDTLLRLADSAQREQRAFDERTDGWIRENVREETPGVWVVGLDMFTLLEDDDATALWRDALVHAGFARDVGRTHYARLLELARDPHAGSSADLPGFSARREHDALVLCRTASERPAAGVADGAPAAPGGGVIGDRTRRAAFTARLTIPGRTHAAEWTIDADFVAGDDARRVIASREAGGDVAYFDADALSTPLFARAPRPGDRMRPLGLDGHKKLSDLFVDRKIPRRHRERALVVEGDTIHWVAGVATSGPGCVGPATTRALRLRATRA